MKSIILFTLILIVNFSFAQERNTYLKTMTFNTNIEENHYSDNDNNSILEIKLLELLEPINNSEGKFPMYKLDGEHVDLILNGKSKIINNYSSKNLMSLGADATRVSENLLTQNEVKLIQTLILKKLLKEGHTDVAFVKEYQIKGNLNNELYKNIPLYKDKLNVNLKISNNIEVQLGENLEGYMARINKTELDKTLQNSLNLLIVSF
ncbi:hypothetical protein [uncultured Polaribacter sp.]|uniref:hypothetical protein n=1 Tax=uncultured Polaribacter sp. TaxID=174711 RepID=UPI0026308A88|nr:hypothetical protein [uncultured Polaribacter sp.]